MRHRLAFTVLAIATATASGQSRTNNTGTITGHVFCSDTNEPARFAEVSLAPIATPSKSKSASSTAATDGRSVETTLDGSFTIPKVKPGAYYVVVKKSGYINPHTAFTADQLAHPTADIRSLIAASMPHVVVEANHSETAEVSLERGASVSGTIRYDDGSPAGDLSIDILHKDDTGEWVSSEEDDAYTPPTDDHGNFRLASLLPGDYLIQALLDLSDTENSTLPGPTGEVINYKRGVTRFSLSFYGSGTAHISEAKPLTLTAGQELTGQDMTIPISTLHKLTGHVAAGRDAHFVNSAKLSLVTRDDGKELTTSDVSRDDGLFHFDFVPDGDYILKVTEVHDSTWETPRPTHNDLTPPAEKEHILASYGDTELPILLSDDQLDIVATVSPDAVPATPNQPKSNPTTVDAQSNPTPSSTPDATPTRPPPSAPEANPQLRPKPTPDAEPAVALLH